MRSEVALNKLAPNLKRCFEEMHQLSNLVGVASQDRWMAFVKEKVQWLNVPPIPRSTIFKMLRNVFDPQYHFVLDEEVSCAAIRGFMSQYPLTLASWANGKFLYFL